MNRNIAGKNTEIMQLCHIISCIKDEENLYKFLCEILTETEIKTLAKRWRILKMLFDGVPQREIAKELNVSLCKITRGAAILRNKNTVISKILHKEKNNEYE